MTYAGLSTLMLRFLGFLTMTAVVFYYVPAAITSGQFPAFMMLTGIGLVPGLFLIVASKPLGNILAAGIE